MEVIEKKDKIVTNNFSISNEEEKRRPFKFLSIFELAKYCAEKDKKFDGCVPNSDFCIGGKPIFEIFGLKLEKTKQFDNVDAPDPKLTYVGTAQVVKSDEKKDFIRATLMSSADNRLVFSVYNDDNHWVGTFVLTGKTASDYPML